MYNVVTSTMARMLEDIVSHWKIHSFRDSDIPYGDAIYSLDTREPAIELKQCGQYEWVVSGVAFCSAGAQLLNEVDSGVRRAPIPPQCSVMPEYLQTRTTTTQGIW